jgi:hypothetical protein
MRLKASGWQPDDHPGNGRDPGTGDGAPTKSSELDPIPSQSLEIASLARGRTAVDEERVDDGGAPRLAIGLYRRHLGIGAKSGYFTLKMMLVRTLRRSHKHAVIEVDDAEGEPPGEQLYEISLEPADSKALARATRTVQRVLRARRWQSGLIR